MRLGIMQMLDISGAAAKFGLYFENLAGGSWFLICVLRIFLHGFGDASMGCLAFFFYNLMDL